jgi:hypothetical protein
MMGTMAAQEVKYGAPHPMHGTSVIDIILLIAVVMALTLFFAFTNGFQDASATVATMVACGAATPRTGVLYSRCSGSRALFWAAARWRSPSRA